MPSVESFGNNIAEQDAYADLKVAVTGQYVGLVMKLTKSLINVDRNTTLAVLTAAEADFDGYAAATKTVTPGAALIDPADRAEDWLVGPTFAPTGSATPNQCFNWWIENGAGLLILAGNINGVLGIQMASVADALQVTARHRIRYDCTAEIIY